MDKFAHIRMVIGFILSLSIAHLLRGVARMIEHPGRNKPFYVTCSLIFPDDLRDYEGYRDYFYSRRAWFFSLLSLTFLADIADTMLKGSVYAHALGPEYPFRIGIHFCLCLLAIRIRKEWFQGTLVIAFIVYELSWILRRYLIE